MLTPGDIIALSRNPGNGNFSLELPKMYFIKKERQKLIDMVPLLTKVLLISLRLIFQDGRREKVYWMAAAVGSLRS
jgi:hypothetical protein